MIDLSAALAAFAVPGGIRVLRRDLGWDADGRYVEPEPVELAGVPASVQPTGTEDIQLLPEGVRTRKAITVYSPFVLRTAAAEGHPADQVVYRGETFDVHMVRDWDIVGGYRKAVAVRVG